jgi:streptomycin 6-kinase
LYALVDAAGLDEDVARAYALVRVVRQATIDSARLTTYVAVVKALQD